MNYPEFYDLIPEVRVYDPLAGFLGAAEAGIIEYRYLDAVKLAGHSCPIVASAYWMMRLALKALFDEELPIRGGVRVEFSEQRDVGVTGVMANVVQLLTGAATEDGFKGISGIFFRNGLMRFGVAGDFQIRLIHRDSLQHVDVSVDLSRIPVSRDMRQIMLRKLNGESDLEEARLFGQLWQDRVKRLILDHGEDADVFRVIKGRHK